MSFQEVHDDDDGGFSGFGGPSTTSSGLLAKSGEPMRTSSGSNLYEESARPTPKATPPTKQHQVQDEDFFSQFDQPVKASSLSPATAPSATIPKKASSNPDDFFSEWDVGSAPSNPTTSSPAVNVATLSTKPLSSASATPKKTTSPATASSSIASKPLSTVAPSTTTTGTVKASAVQNTPAPAAIDDWESW
eukprot:TRINITY_DN6345_c0_g1_i1.p1 TRINITY_DN6345_c0_g1~~TRINITY_DN6345_c0_g1_i1.p1  ORF type:complete len:191 (+),score=50.00 TRINITY_DN6345_c0_g1_i1:1218-1790(+)